LACRLEKQPAGIKIKCQRFFTIDVFLTVKRFDDHGAVKIVTCQNDNRVNIGIIKDSFGIDTRFFESEFFGCLTALAPRLETIVTSRIDFPALFKIGRKVALA
jgi:hypothetical protein